MRKLALLFVLALPVPVLADTPSITISAGDAGGGVVNATGMYTVPNGATNVTVTVMVKMNGTKYTANGGAGGVYNIDVSGVPQGTGTCFATLSYTLRGGMGGLSSYTVPVAVGP